MGKGTDDRTQAVNGDRDAASNCGTISVQKRTRHFFAVNSYHFLYFISQARTVIVFTTFLWPIWSQCDPIRQCLIMTVAVEACCKQGTHAMK